MTSKILINLPLKLRNYLLTLKLKKMSLLIF